MYIILAHFMLMMIRTLDQCNSVLVGTSVYLQDRLQSVMNATARLVYSRRTSEHNPTATGVSLVAHPGTNPVPVVCSGIPEYQHRRPTSEIVARRCLRSADTTTLQVPSTHRATLGDRAFLVAAARAWNSLPLETRACSSLLTFRRKTKSHLFRQSYG